MKKCSALLVIVKCKLKLQGDTTIQPAEWQRLKRREQGGGRTGAVMQCWWEWKMAQPLWKKFGWFLVKLDIHLLYNAATLLLGLPKRNKSMCPGKVIHKCTEQLCS